MSSPASKWKGMTWNRPWAPELETTPGAPQDSICMTVAARLGSILKKLDQARILSDQCCTSGVKMGARAPLAGGGWEALAAPATLGVRAGGAFLGSPRARHPPNRQHSLRRR